MPTASKNGDIRSLRRSKKLTISALALDAGIDATRLRKLERGLETANESELIELAKVLDSSFSMLKKNQRSFAKLASTGEGYVTARPESTFTTLPSVERQPGKIPILDLFCGTGGFSHGFEQTDQFSVISGIDLLPDRIGTFSANHPWAKSICCDISNIESNELCIGVGKPEVVIGGPPCQGFSSIRPFRLLTETDNRNNLFERFALTVENFRPSWFVFENVVGLLTTQKGAILSQIIELFESIGYRTSWRVLNAAFYGLPQRRERFILVGNRVNQDFEWPEPTHYFEGSRSMAGKFRQHADVRPLFPRSIKHANSVMDAIHDLPELESGESSVEYRTGVKLTEYEREMRGNCNTLTLHESTKHSEKMLEIIRHAGFSKAALPDGMVTSGFSTCYSRLEPDLPAVTITVNFVHPASNKCIHPFQNRALTPREGARLQGFPDEFKFVGSKAQIIKQIGNAVPPLLGRVIAESLARRIV